MPMRVRLVGTNVDLAALKRDLDPVDAGSFLATPEPIAAAYARISRSEKSVDELRAEAHADVGKARRSNRNIVFEMGHASIAEHAVFNFDIEGVSRLAIEQLEHTRLASYTERSQRYVLLGRDYLLPDEVVNDGGSALRAFEECVDNLFQAYGEMYGKLLAWHLETAEQPVKRRRRRELETLAREDARYLLPLATTGQLGMTINARSLENTVRRLKANPLHEVRELGRLLEEEAIAVTPSLIRYTEPARLESCVDPQCYCASWGRAVEPGGVRLVSVTPEGDELVAGMMCKSSVSDDRETEEGSRVEEYFRGATAHDRAPRCFEFVDLVFELVCSASCFAQLKRHRMASLLAGPYDPGLGVMIPPSIRDCGGAARFVRATDDVEETRLGAISAGKALVEYLLTNAHCRRVLLKMNLRDLYHFSRLRMDGHAQWEIRELAGRMCLAAADKLPMSGRFLGGKDQFGESA